MNKIILNQLTRGLKRYYSYVAYTQIHTSIPSVKIHSIHLTIQCHTMNRCRHNMARAPVHIVLQSNRYTIKIIEKWGVWEKLYKISHHFNSHHIILYYIIKCYPKKKIFFIEFWLTSMDLRILVQTILYDRTTYTV